MLPTYTHHLVQVDCSNPHLHLQGFDEEAVGFVACRLKKAFLFRGDVVYRRGDAAEDMYIVVEGKVCVS